MAALDRVPGIRAVLGLFEGVCTGAADGYARMAGKPALTLLHLGPGLANGLANLHNARRAGSPVVNLVGEHASWHRPHDPPLASDIGLLAGWASGWVRISALVGRAGRGRCGGDRRGVGGQGGDADRAGRVPVGSGRAGVRRCPPAPAARAGRGRCGRRRRRWPAEAASLRCCSARRRCPRPVCAPPRGSPPRPGARLLTETFSPAPSGAAACLLRPGCRTSRSRRGRRSPGSRSWSSRGRGPPVAFFAYPGMPSSPAPEGAAITTLAQRGAGRGAGGGRSRSSAWRICWVRRTSPPRPCPSPSRRRARSRPRRSRPRSWPACRRAPSWSTRAPRRRWPTSRRRRAPRGTPTSATSAGRSGRALPVAVGAALAAPDRPVIALQADGSGLYTVQALWTQAREGLNITTVVCANHRYRILQVELARAGQEPLGPAGARLTGLDEPRDRLGPPRRGASACRDRRVTSADDLTAALEWALADGGPAPDRGRPLTRVPATTSAARRRPPVLRQLPPRRRRHVLGRDAPRSAPR